VLLVEFPGSLSLKLSTAAIYVISGIPVFLLSYLCLKWLPRWLYPDDDGKFSPLFYGLAGSCLAFGSASINLFIQRLQQESLLLLHQDFFLAVRVRQANVFLHLLKNLIVPVTSTYCAQFPILLSGAIVVEMIFTYPGIGHWLLLAVENKDFPVIMPVCSVLVVSVCTANIIKDLIQLSVDPKLRT
jgi:peptide/nickel transport system permease protein